MLVAQASLLPGTSLTADANGAKVLEIRYKAWGEVRATWTNVPVNIDPAYKMPLYTYTGQAAYLDDPLTSGVTEGFGLMFYNARWYDPYITHFVQADTIVPAGAQGLDRYAAMNNNPIKYVDPTGHDTECGLGQTGCTHKPKYKKTTTPQSTPTPETIDVIIACGVDAGAQCEKNYEDHDDPPLLPYAEWSDKHGYHTDKIGIDPYRGHGTSKADMALAIFALIKNADGKVFLVGHSAGADAVILAVQMAIEAGMKDKISGIALLDPYFQDDNQNSLQTQADNITKQLSGNVFLADTPNDGIDVKITGATEKPYAYSHIDLAYADEVLTDLTTEMSAWR